MAWTTPGTATAGEVLTAAFWNTQVRDNMVELAPLFVAWSSWTPTISQGVTTNIATTAKSGQYLKVGRLCVLACSANMNGNGTAGSQVTISTPTAITFSNATTRAGVCHVYDNSTNTRYTGAVEIGAGVVTFVGDWSGGSGWGVSPNLAVAANDQLDFTLIAQCVL